MSIVRSGFVVRGPAGAAGATGSQGPAGAAGATGPQGPAGPSGTTTWQDIWVPKSIADFSSQPTHVKVRIGTPTDTRMGVDWAAEGATLRLRAAAQETYASGDYAGVALVMPCAAPNFTVDFMLDSFTNTDTANASYIHLGVHYPGPEKAVNSARMTAAIDRTSVGRRIVKSWASTNGTHNENGSTSLAAFSSIKVKLSVRAGKEFKVWYGLDGADATTAIDSDTWRGLGGNYNHGGQITGALVLGLGNGNGNGSADISCRVTAFTVSGVSWA